MDIFDIIGPVMIGPSSSHTAGAVRIGRVGRTILGEQALRAEVGLAGSFAKTYKGHGTDKAIVAGILGLGPG
ncbi:MAG: L-serine ammonia-lyase, iron-sulfur-dependent, subunit beta, partial [Clostridiales Family XIII bacterium]|nr:L-serine ammonia-lyase, iron-sulfur-dependent, subunit beta [Clostridiales Family XIII bacterium]